MFPPGSSESEQERETKKYSVGWPKTRSECEQSACRDKPAKVEVLSVVQQAKEDHNREKQLRGIGAMNIPRKPRKEDRCVGNRSGPSDVFQRELSDRQIEGR